MRTSTLGRHGTRKRFQRVFTFLGAAILLQATNHAEDRKGSTLPLNRARVVSAVKISPDLPPFRFKLKPDLESEELKADAPIIGQIEVFKGNSAKAAQSIDVRSSHWSWLMRSFETIDINMDGYQDLRVIHSVGGKWGQHTYRLYEPKSDLFITNSLTTALDELTHNGINLNPEKMELRTSHFWGICTLPERTYRVEKDGLVLLEEKLHLPIRAGVCNVEIKRRVDEKMVTVWSGEQEHDSPLLEKQNRKP